MKMAGIVLMMAGLIALIYGGITFTSQGRSAAGDASRSEHRNSCDPLTARGGTGGDCGRRHAAVHEHETPLRQVALKLRWSRCGSCKQAVRDKLNDFVGHEVWRGNGKVGLALEQFERDSIPLRQKRLGAQQHSVGSDREIAGLSL